MTYVTSSGPANWTVERWTTDNSSSGQSWLDPGRYTVSYQTSDISTWSPAYMYDSYYGDFIPPNSFEDLLNFIPQSLSLKEIDELTSYYQNTLKEHMDELSQQSPNEDQDDERFFTAYQECQLILRDEMNYLEDKLTDLENEINDINSQMLLASASGDEVLVADLTLRLPALESKKNINCSDRYELGRLISMADNRMRQYEQYKSHRADRAEAIRTNSRFNYYNLGPDYNYNSGDLQISRSGQIFGTGDLVWEYNPEKGVSEAKMAVDGELYTLTLDPVNNEMVTIITKQK